MADIELKVSTGVLKGKAQEIQENIRSFESHFYELARIVQGMGGYWQGEASQVHQKQFVDIRADMQEAIKRLGEHPIHLMKMAGIYEAAEDDSRRETLALPKDVLL